MSELDPQIDELQKRLDQLVKTQIGFQAEISAIRNELARLAQPRWPQAAESSAIHDTPTAEAAPPPPSSVANEPQPEARDATFRPEAEPAQAYAPPPRPEPNPARPYAPAARSNVEEFVGKNLISLIGVIILILGVGIGAKYAIDNGWISPTLRIAMAYAIGITLLFAAVRLKSKYLNFSAVLMSGGIATLYFVTYFAHSAYELISQPFAFILMAVLTVCTVVSAIWYNRQVIAHIGLVGAYAVPFLLSSSSGRYASLFTYVAIVNLGILAISVIKYWRSIFYTASAFTWLIFLAWFTSKYSSAEHFYLALTFLAIFFLIFYAAKVVHGVFHSDHGDIENIGSTIGTAFIFYSFLFAISDLNAGAYQYAVLFSYLAFFSLLILLTSFRFYGRFLVFVTYPFTWLIFGAWFATKFDTAQHLTLAAVFASVFFAIYYGASLVYRLVTEEIGMIENAGVVLTNSFVFYGFGFAMLQSRPELHPYKGLFTAFHGVFHFLVAQAVSRIRSNSRDVVQVLVILVITFTTIAVPVQFEGNHVTLIWAVEAAALFYFGRVRGVRLFEYFSYPLMGLAFASLVIGWAAAYAQRTDFPSEWNRQPVMNGEFVTAIVFIIAFAFIYRIHTKSERSTVMGDDFARPFGLMIGAVTLGVLYNLFRREIGNYYHLQIVSYRQALVGNVPVDSGAETNRDLVFLNALWQIDYTMLFLSVLAAINIARVRSFALAYANILLSLLTLGVFSVVGMILFHELRVTYLDAEAVRLWGSGSMNIAIRYISYLFAALLMFTLYLYSRDEVLDGSAPRSARAVAFDAVLHSTALIAASCELVNLMAQFGIPDGTKLGLSILWGVYALLLIVIGIARDKKYLRISAIVIFAVTLVKLFFYDIADLPTIPKTILFVSLGVLLLIVSFLYNKYKSIIFRPAPDDGK